ncbi:hypothetical protein SUGI_1024370 [Cryptomeria japonica]|nr:hypothetical protein SUGI_1024370 [Cryptomeria japonica]
MQTADGSEFDAPDTPFMSFRVFGFVCEFLCHLCLLSVVGPGAIRYSLEIICRDGQRYGVNVLQLDGWKLLRLNREED